MAVRLSCQLENGKLLLKLFVNLRLLLDAQGGRSGTSNETRVRFNTWKDRYFLFHES
jgi:hypothetical protein